MSTTQRVKQKFVLCRSLLHLKTTFSSQLHISCLIGKTHCMFTIQSQANIAENIVLSFEQVVAVRTFEHNGYVVVAVLTGPIFSQAERQELLQSIKDMVADTLEISQSHILASYDMELFRAMDNISDNEKDKLLEKAMQTQSI
jgi:hypothetical protein